ncbi:MAG: isopentenyl-diphosphate Delta-isomerase [Flavobacteriaceae bacterium]|nr:isopentenyl-diphosphate Delta-isomerase [Flavobacteriaceae bacterium]
MKEENVILVNEQDEPIGLMPKMEAHEKAMLHRAFSVFVFNAKGELMLQQRALHKYHSPGLWTNTCCSHQRDGETNLAAGARRLQEEMGFVVPLKELFSFIYKAPFDNGLTEHELDHVMVGHSETVPHINEDEVAAWKWMSMDAIANEMKEHPERYTEWFKIIFDRVFTYLKNNNETS